MFKFYLLGCLSAAIILSSLQPLRTQLSSTAINKPGKVSILYNNQPSTCKLSPLCYTCYSQMTKK